ncbi:Geranylgeranyl pyrophosphate synthetase [Acromyrmex echinatior]|uniref:Geranylgeranyl pyrophosphate synthetase n=1 Tax=Acromyrmex echinatior TaxID=103372 RepID=F4WJ66_ACREC|nr:Geranylgeranyl pyrophosphate synthetase [Acromyrmex echinatior]
MKFLFLARFDDIQDEAIMRNGFPVTHSVYGLHYSINAANYLQFLACEKLINLHPMDTNENSYCDDLTEGKMSFLIIHALRNNPDDKKIINILKQRSKNIEVKRYCVKILESYGSFKYAKDVLDELEEKMRTEIDRLGGNPPFVKLLDDFRNKMLKTHI